MALTTAEVGVAGEAEEGKAAAAEVPCVTLTHAQSGASVVLSTFGATLLSWRPAGARQGEMLFVSEQAVRNGSKPIRGGVPVVFPVFGNPSEEEGWNAAMPKHGFVRTAEWEVDTAAEAPQRDDCAEMTLKMADTAATHAVWPHEFRLRLKVRITPLALEMVFTAHNAGREAIPAMQALLHSYLRVPDIGAVRVKNLRGRPFIDKLAPAPESGEALPTEEREGIEITEETDRIYTGPTTRDVLLQSEDGESIVSVSARAKVVRMPQDAASTVTPAEPEDEAAAGESEFLDTDVVLWNPWVNKAASLADLADEEYRSFVCIEPGVVSRSVALNPRDTFNLSMLLCSFPGEAPASVAHATASDAAAAATTT